MKIAPTHNLDFLWSTQDGIALLDQGLVVLFANPRSRAFFGGAMSGPEGHQAETLLGPDHPIVELLHATARGENVRDRRIESPDGSIFLVSMFRIDRDPIPGALLIVLRDMGPIIEHQETLEGVRRPLRETTLISGMAHQLRSPLHGMNMRLELLRKECGEGADRHLERLRQEIQRVDLVIGTILRLTRPNPRMVPFDLNALIAELVKGLAGNQVAVQMALAPDQVMVRGDRAMLSEAISAVLINALETMPEAGKLRVTTARRAEMADLVIADDGPGIPHAKLATIFDIDHTNAADDRLGLPFAMRSIELNGGKISLQSEVGQGTTCTISLPAAANQSS